MVPNAKDSGRDEADDARSASSVSGAYLSADAKHVTALVGAIGDYLTTSAPFAKLDPLALNTVAYELANELMFLAATQGAQAANARARGKRGTRAKVGEAALIGRLQALAARNGVTLQQWRNGHGKRENLTTICTELMQLAGIRGTVSQRTAVLAGQQTRMP